MRVVIEILNGCIYDIAADEPCELLIIDRDEFGDEVLPDGKAGYVNALDVPGNPHAVDEAFEFAGFLTS